MEKERLYPDYLFEVSWEVCNKVGGIHTVVSTKTVTLYEKLKDNHILIGPDILHYETGNVEFIEDQNLFRSWKDFASKQGIRVRTGRWNIVNQPVVILIDFTPYFNEKDKIFAQLWEQYKLDSITGQWDYIEPALFGYSAGIVIESFCKFYTSFRDKIIAQFHEWMTGAGILYLKKNFPQAGTVFTTHATVVGRSIAGNGLSLYEKLNEYDGDLMAKQFNVVSKQSLEKTSAFVADAFTTVSNITAKECSQFLKKDVDIVTPNGFDDSFLPDNDNYNNAYNQARTKFRQVAEALLNEKLDDDTLFIGTSGRYEFRNKGIDLFIDALGKLNRSEKLNKKIVAFILVPANNYGPRNILLKALNEQVHENEIQNKILTHNLHDAEFDPILNKLNEWKLDNSPGNKVKAIFVPSYLNGNDGIFNLKYYDLLPGLDLTVFASYYEPWGYTPLESLAFHVPTITTSLSGFGVWVQSELKEDNDAVFVIQRHDGNDEEVINGIINKIINCSGKTPDDKTKIREEAFKVSRIALWQNLITHYLEAYNIALDKVNSRQDQFVDTQQSLLPYKHYDSEGYTPNWHKVYVKTTIPENFAGLLELANNVWWSWNYKAMELFKYIDKKLWRESRYNPISLLDEIPVLRYKQLAQDTEFVSMYNEVMTEFHNYLKEKENQKPPKIAYFSMEFGFNDNIKIFSGGLGILAGDYLKEASDTNVDMVGVGLLYRHGYFKQTLSINGEQQAVYEPQKFSQLPISPARDKDDNWVLVSIALPGRIVYARVWVANIGRNAIYLLDTDFDRNSDEDRKITYQLYGGDIEHRFKQEMLLGVCGIRALNALNIKPDIYHINEGHAAFMGLERLRVLRTKRNLTFSEALEIIRASTLFTTHTPVPAGHDIFDEDLMRKYMAHYPARLKISWEEMMSLGKVNPQDNKFSMSYLAANVSQEVNGVSWLHGEVTKKLFADLWKGYFPEESHIGYVTNGVHFDTWTAKSWKKLYSETFGDDFKKNLNDHNLWQKIYNVQDYKIWEIRQYQRKKLVDYVKDRVKRNWIRRYENPKSIVEVVANINPDTLTIGFARRFATYKRAHLLFRNLERLNSILNNPEKPVQILFAGKAHPNDKAGQDLIKQIVEISKRKEFLGKVIFLENYDIELAKKLVQGVDIWMNTPTRPLEASGTSGMKAVMNGVLHFSVLDGWWVEGYKENAGWALPEERTYQNQEFQDELDAETIYEIIENEIVPLFYKRDSNNIPVDWIQYIKKSIAFIAPEFTTKRMLDDYQKRFYHKLYNRSLELKENNYALAIEIDRWKKSMRKRWETIKVVSVNIPDYEKTPLKMTEAYKGEVCIDIGEVKPEEIGMDLVIANRLPNNEVKIAHVFEADIVKVVDNKAYFKIEKEPIRPGHFSYGLRIYPKHDKLPHRQDFCLVKWI
ncbi:MAG: hypothetical protein Kow0068_04150 [Marinilabiliales bacterium]